MTKNTETKQEKNKAPEVTTENNCDVDKTRQDISDLYKNVTMAQNSIKTLLPYVDNQDVTKVLHKQVEQYDHYIEQIGTLAENLNFDPHARSQNAYIYGEYGHTRKMLSDKSVTHVAKIMLQRNA